MGCVDFCDADAYCKWAGKRLCGRIGGGATLTADESIDPKASEWVNAVNACTQGGKTKLPYGDTFEAGRCIDDTRMPKGAGLEGLAVLANPQKNAPECRGTEPPFDKIYSMSVGMQEWDDSVVGDTPENATAGLRGGNYCWNPKEAVPLDCAEPDGTEAWSRRVRAAGPVGAEQGASQSARAGRRLSEDHALAPASRTGTSRVTRPSSHLRPPGKNRGPAGREFGGSWGGGLAGESRGAGRGEGLCGGREPPCPSTREAPLALGLGGRGGPQPRAPPRAPWPGTPPGTAT